ncbi:hypothetical protein [Tsukamurella pseudospumae]|uniref:hypothetical protein n=1 Tax=Tsukamurella pseudospumae TaxID=239498 RepID=UPI0011125D89|nr:hypothetical protein [Tsukamurella pseudospumae]
MAAQCGVFGGLRDVQAGGVGFGGADQGAVHLGRIDEGAVDGLAEGVDLLAGPVRIARNRLSSDVPSPIERRPRELHHRGVDPSQHCGEDRETSGVRATFCSASSMAAIRSFALTNPRSPAKI